MRVPTINELQELWVYKRVNQYSDEHRPSPDYSLFIAEFQEAIDKIKADAWAEGWSHGLGTGRDEFDALSIDDNPYRKQEEA